VQRDGYIQKLRKYCDQITEYVLDDLFNTKAAIKFSFLTFKDINERFKKDKYVK
jgi:hypothetical protein